MCLEGLSFRCGGGGSGDRCRNPDAERRALVDAAFEGNTPFDEGDDAAGGIKAQSQTAKGAVITVIDLTEAIEDDLAGLFLDADPGVLDKDLDAAVLAPRAEHDLARMGKLCQIGRAHV